MKYVSYILVPTAILILWTLTSASGSVPSILLPSPKEVFDAFCVLASDGSLTAHILSSASRTLTGFAIALLAGLILGFLFAKSKSSERFGYLLIEALRLTPPLAIIPLLILWLGLDEAPKIAIVFLSSFFPIYMNTLTAVRGVDQKLLEVGKVLNFNVREEFTLLTLPAALPGILTGIRVGFGYSWRALVGAELIAASSGLGFLISESAEFSKTDTVFVGILTIVVLGVAADKLLTLGLNRFLAHRTETAGNV